MEAKLLRQTVARPNTQRSVSINAPQKIPAVKNPAPDLHIRRDSLLLDLQCCEDA